MVRHVFPDLPVLRLAPVLAPDPEKLAELLGEVRDEPRAGRGPTTRPDVRDHDATHLMTAAMVPSRWRATNQVGSRSRCAGRSTRRSASPERRSRCGVGSARRIPRRPVAGSAPHSGPRSSTCRRGQVLEVRFDAHPDARAHPGRRGTRLQRPRAARPAAVVHLRRRRPVPGRRHQRTQAVRRRPDRPTSVGLPQTDYANLPDWTLVEVVGFPFAKSEIAPPDYDPVPQGRAAPSLDGVDAALLRLTAGQLIQLDPPAPGGGLAAPAWPFPDPATFLDVLRKGSAADHRRLPDDQPRRRPEPAPVAAPGRPTPWPACTSPASPRRRRRPTCR